MQLRELSITEEIEAIVIRALDDGWTPSQVETTTREFLREYAVVSD